MSRGVIGRGSRVAGSRTSVCAIEQAADLGGHGIGVIGDRRRGDDAERVGLQAPAARSGNRVLLAEAECVAPRLRLSRFPRNTSFANASSCGTARKLFEIARRESRSGAQAIDERAGLVHDRDIGVAEPVDRLLAIADEKNRRHERRALGDAAALAPRSDQQRDELPLRPARVLKLVEQHVVIAPLEPVAAARELVHLRQQRQRLRERLRKIEHAVRVERLAIFAEGDLVDAPDASRQARH